MPTWTLQDLGWTDDLEAERKRSVAPDDQVGRIGIEYGGIYKVLLPADEASPENLPREVNAVLRGRWRKADELDRPAVGDFVAVRESGDGLAIEHRFERRTRFLRQSAGRKPVPQVVGANVDVVFLVMALDRDFNPRRAERYLAAILDGGAQPVIVLTKADIAEDPEGARATLADIAQGSPIEVISTIEGRGVEAVRRHLGRGMTGALAGSSGVGKSTLVNALAGAAIQRTRAVRQHDSRGRHTTTHRELILLAPEQGMLVDTPGMRELQLWMPGDGLAQAFDDVEQLAEACRFRDCKHQGEPGCAVDAAIAEGTLSAERKASYLKLREEEARTPRPRRGR